MAKAFSELTESELVNLSSEDVTRYIDLACAEEGIGLLPPRPVEPTKENVADDLDAYQVGSSVDLVFLDAGDAAHVAAAINATRTRGFGEYVSGPSYRRKFHKLSDSVTVTSIRLLSADRLATMGDRLAAYEAEQKAYTADLAEFERTLKARQNVGSSIHSDLEKAHRTYSLRERRRGEYARYLELADGNAAVATRFLLRAFPDARELMPELGEPDRPVPPPAPVTEDAVDPSLSTF